MVITSAPAPAPKCIPDLLRACAFVPVGSKEEFWNPPDGSSAVSTDVAAARVVNFWNTARMALLARPFYQTSEFWMAASGPLMGVPAAVAGLAGMADFLGPTASTALTSFAAFTALATPVAYKVARHLAKHYAAREGVTLPPDGTIK